MKQRFVIDRPADKLLALLIATAMFLLFLDVYHFFTGVLGEPIFDLESNDGLGHNFRRIQEFWIVLMLLAMALRKWRFLCLSWGLLFGAYLVDDSLSLHEWLGLTISQKFDLPSPGGVRPQDLGEMLVYGSWGLLCTGLVALAHFLSWHDARRFSRGLFGLLMLLILFGAGMDLAQALAQQRWLHAAFGKLEEAGSMMAVSVIVWFLLRQGEVRSDQ